MRVPRPLATLSSALWQGFHAVEGSAGGDEATVAAAVLVAQVGGEAENVAGAETEVATELDTEGAEVADIDAPFTTLDAAMVAIPVVLGLQVLLYQGHMDLRDGVAATEA